MSTASPEKSKGFENQIEKQLQAMDLSAEALDEVGLETGRVSEVLSEGTGENISTRKRSQKDQKTGLKIISQQVAGLLSGGVNNGAAMKVLPTPVVQKRKVKKAIEKRTRKLVNQATKMQNSKNFSASHLEEILFEIRHLREVLSEMVQITVDRVEELYRRYVMGIK